MKRILLAPNASQVGETRVPGPVGKDEGPDIVPYLLGEGLEKGGGSAGHAPTVSRVIRHRHRHHFAAASGSFAPGTQLPPGIWSKGKWECGNRRDADCGSSRGICGSSFGEGWRRRPGEKKPPQSHSPAKVIRSDLLPHVGQAKASCMSGSEAWQLGNASSSS